MKLEKEKKQTKPYLILTFKLRHAPFKFKRGKVKPHPH